jgi:hypothetical protein
MEKLSQNGITYKSLDLTSTPPHNKVIWWQEVNDRLFHATKEGTLQVNID